MKYKWVSFSLDGENQGICNVEASSEEKALKRCSDLGITPKYDDVLILNLPKPEYPLDELISRDALVKDNYEAVTDEDMLSLMKNASQILNYMEN